MKLLSVAPAYTTDGGTGSLLDTANDVAVLDVRHLTNIEIFVNQIVDAGTCTIDIARTIDGTNWDAVGQFTEASFPAGANMSQSLLLVDSNGMPLLAKQIRITLTAVAGGGTYTVTGFGKTLADGERILFDTSGTYSPDGGTAGSLETVNDAVTFDTTGLTNIEVMLNQTTDPGAGTCTILVERSIDGTNWDLIASVADTDFAAANNVSFPVSFSGTGGVPMHAKQVRARLTAKSAGGAWSACVVGKQVPGYR